MDGYRRTQRLSKFHGVSVRLRYWVDTFRRCSVGRAARASFSLRCAGDTLEGGKSCGTFPICRAGRLARAGAVASGWRSGEFRKIQRNHYATQRGDGFARAGVVSSDPAGACGAGGGRRAGSGDPVAGRGGEVAVCGGGEIGTDENRGVLCGAGLALAERGQAGMPVPPTAVTGKNACPTAALLSTPGTRL